MKKLFLLLLTLLPMAASADESGECGDGVTYFFEEATGTLTISKTSEGTGKMTGYSFNAPWYSYRDKILKVVIQDGVTSIGDSAFEGCSNLTSLTIGKGVTSIGGSAFSGCRGLISVNIPDGVNSIGKYTFSGCNSLVSVIIPTSVTSIGISAFSNCNSLASVVIPNGVKTIGEKTFASCSGLTSVTIPNSVTSIGDDAFYGCKGLNEVHINDLTAWCNISFSGYDSNPLREANHLFLNDKEITNLFCVVIKGLRIVN